MLMHNSLFLGRPRFTSKVYASFLFRSGSAFVSFFMILSVFSSVKVTTEIVLRRYV